MNRLIYTQQRNYLFTQNDESTPEEDINLSQKHMTQSQTSSKNQYPYLLHGRSQSRNNIRICKDIVSSTFQLQEQPKQKKLKITVIPKSTTMPTFTSFPSQTSLSNLGDVVGNSQINIKSLMAPSNNHNRTQSDISMSKHHIHSLRLKNGQWLQTKNISITPAMIPQSQNLLQQPDPMRHSPLKQHRKFLNYMVSQETDQRIQTTLANRYETIVQEKNLVHFLQKDQYYLQFKLQSKNLEVDGDLVRKDRQRYQERLKTSVSKRHILEKEKNKISQMINLKFQTN